MMLFILLFMALATIAQGDSAPDEYVLPVRIHFADKPAKEVWVSYNPNRFHDNNPENDVFTRPIPGRKVLFMNKLERRDSLVYSEKVHVLPDSHQCVIPKTMAYKGITLIEDISSDSLAAFTFWGNLWLTPSAGKLLTTKKPLFTDLIVLEQEVAYNAEHVYNYDPALTKEKIRQLYKKGGRDNPILKKAIDENRVILVEDVSP